MTQPYRSYEDVPAEVREMTPEAQVEWFRGQRNLMMPASQWAEFHVNSVQHKGLCCSSCIDDMNEGYIDWDIDEFCCCIAMRHDDA